MPRFSALDLGPLPVDLINAVLHTELEPGSVRLSKTAHEHIASDHPDDYAACILALTGGGVQSPTYIGQDPSHAGNFVMVKRVGLPDGRAVLVAIGLKPDKLGVYSVRSSYLIRQEVIDTRRRSGRLHIPSAK